jgi:hypothetical protein
VVPGPAPARPLRAGDLKSAVGDAVERVLIVSFQPDPAKAASRLASALVRALARLKDRRGVLIAQLDELVLGREALVAEVPFLPSEPVALCLTGTPGLVAAARAALAGGSPARFAIVRPAAHVGVLRVAAAACDGAIVIDVTRELGGNGAARLTAAGWRVTSTEGEDEAALPLWEAAALLKTLGGAAS